MASSKQAIHVTVIVLGDLGRSPRMRYHALALADNGAEVDLIGYAGSALPQILSAHPRIRCHLMTPTPVPFLDRFKERLFPAVSLARIVIQGLRLLGLLLFVVRKPQVVLVQNPPAVPALAVALVAARLRSARLVIDWHNFGYSVLALKLGASSRLVGAMRRYERALGRLADGHLAVSRAMQAELKTHWGLAPVDVIYDRPAEEFVRTRSRDRGALGRRLAEIVAAPELSLAGPLRPAVLVSSTSWTADEDFDLLLDALSRCDRTLRARGDGARGFPGLAVFISGEGQLRRSFEARVRSMELKNIRIRALWLAPEDYPLLLRAADLGLCLHRSSSGLDLPMKVADMLGAGLPVCALDYGPCLAEELKHGENALLFSNGTELAQQLLDLFSQLPEPSPLLDRLRRNIEAAPQRTWSEEWNERARSAITGISADHE
jgi:beta-1,4-mannosyltransferase